MQGHRDQEIVGGVDAVLEDQLLPLGIHRLEASAGTVPYLAPGQELRHGLAYGFAGHRQRCGLRSEQPYLHVVPKTLAAEVVIQEERSLVRRGRALVGQARHHYGDATGGEVGDLLPQAFRALQRVVGVGGAQPGELPHGVLGAQGNDEVIAGQLFPVKADCLAGQIDPGDLGSYELDPLAAEAAQIAADLPGDLLAQHDGGVGEGEAMPDAAVYQDYAVLGGEQLPQPVGGHQAADPAPQDGYRLAGHVETLFYPKQRFQTKD